MKMNNLADDGDDRRALRGLPGRACKIDLIVRSICALRPGVKRLSKNITVRSIVGRFLEHSRIFYFQNGGDEEMYIGSADMMQRNLDRRVEALVAVKSPELKQQLKFMLDLALSDNASSWSLGAGNWIRGRATKRVTPRSS